NRRRGQPPTIASVKTRESEFESGESTFSGFETESRIRDLESRIPGLQFFHLEADMRSTRQVVDNHLKSFGERSLEGILSDYAPDAVFFTPQGPLKGIAAIRELFVSLLAEFKKPGATFALDHLSVDGDYAYILWHAETADNVYELVTDT